MTDVPEDGVEVVKSEEIEQVSEDPKAVIAFIFPLPNEDDLLGLQRVIGPARTFFTEMPDVKVHAAIRDAAKDIIDILSPPDSNLVKHAERELQYAGNDEDFNRSILKAIKGFVSYGHSGGSAGVAIHILNRLLQNKNLTPLTDNPKEWMKISNPKEWMKISDEEECWQSVRDPEAFSTDGGKTYYLLSEGASPIHLSELYKEPEEDTKAIKREED